MADEYRIRAAYYENDGVYVATSDDVPGLTLESETLGGIIDAAIEHVPELLARNLGLSGPATVLLTCDPAPGSTPAKPCHFEGAARLPAVA